MNRLAILINNLYLKLSLIDKKFKLSCFDKLLIFFLTHISVHNENWPQANLYLTKENKSFKKVVHS